MTRETFQNLVNKVRSKEALTESEKTNFVRYIRFGEPAVINTTEEQDAKMDAIIAEEREKYNFRCSATVS